MQFVPSEKATPIREPSTANLFIDSFDRASGLASNFTINKNQSLFNGYFTRLAVSEVCLNWSVPNISSYSENNSFGVLISSVQTVVTLPDGNYTVASCLQAIVSLLNAAQSVAVFSLVGTYTANQGVTLASTVNFEVLATNLQESLTIQSGQIAVGFFIQNPYLSAYRYLDFVCDNLTYNQQLKDDSTAGSARNTLYRWNFGWDEASPVDTLGFPIYQGYQAFQTRRVLPYPKQIRWEGNMPIGQLAFQVTTRYDEPLYINFPTAQMEWSMTLLVSEV